MKFCSAVEKQESRTMSDSRDRVLIPLRSKRHDKQFHTKYINWRHLVRFGMLLEDLDTFAGRAVEKQESRTMSDSRDRVLIPLRSKRHDKQFHTKYINWRHLVRFGMLLEDLDTFAVWLSYRHNQGVIPSQQQRNLQPMTFVTACVDHISKYIIVLFDIIV
ncbi:unnamed protein product [Gongylonema pulchrum]|uniref:Uncharacterized protein n=1 Tax=Gongylonema pulchrum TaxID=637853 RepID=A0A183E4D3_9BILA|nr:unnamed protein product [Gongylonema pulchrum]